MSANANVFVNFGDGDKAISVKCVIAFDTPITDFHFSLSTLLTIDKISSGTKSEWKIIKEWQPQWQHKSNEIFVSSKTPMNDITVEYHGRVSGWCSIIEEKRIALSDYSAWTLSETSVPVDFIFKIKNMEDYLIINARYDDNEKMWIYGETGHDEGNIIALKKGCFYTASTGNFYFYYLNEAEKIYADCYTSNYDKIMAYLSTLFGEKIINKMSVV